MFYECRLFGGFLKFLKLRVNSEIEYEIKVLYLKIICYFWFMYVKKISLIIFWFFYLLYNNIFYYGIVDYFFGVYDFVVVLEVVCVF